MEDLSQQFMVVSHVQAQAQEGIAAKRLPYVISLPMVHFVFPPTFCISIVSNFFSLLQSSQEKLRTMLMPNLRGQTECIKGRAKLVNAILFHHYYSMF